MERKYCPDSIASVSYTHLDKTILQGYPVHSGRYSKDSLKTLQDNMLYSGTFYEYYLNPAFWGKAYKKELIIPNMLSVDAGISVGEDLCCVYACLLLSLIHICFQEERHY